MADPIDHSRRALIAGAASALLAPHDLFAQAPAIGKTGDIAPVAGNLSADAAAYFATEEPFFKQLAQEFTLDPNVVYFMAAQKGSVPDRKSVV